jgi:hypothetical protein
MTPPVAVDVSVVWSGLVVGGPVVCDPVMVVVVVMVAVAGARVMLVEIPGGGGAFGGLGLRMTVP